MKNQMKRYCVESITTIMTHLLKYVSSYRYVLRKESESPSLQDRGYFYTYGLGIKIDNDVSPVCIVPTPNKGQNNLLDCRQNREVYGK